MQAFYDEFLDRQPDQQEIDDMGHYIVRQPNVIEEAVGTSQAQKSDPRRMRGPLQARARPGRRGR